jgi:NAD(P) transhydrogenase subunit alpha
MIVATLKETRGEERRVALTPAVTPKLLGAGVDVLVEAGAGVAAGFPDASYIEKGARIADSRKEALSTADILVQVHGSLPEQPGDRPGQIRVGFFDPLNSPEAVEKIASTGVTAFSMELVPRTTRAQSMDALSSMATIGGYKAVLLAANLLTKMFPMLMTAAGTITPARVLVIGAGVAGLQAVATARRLGGVVQAYDVRPAAREQVESLGAKFLELPLENGGAEDRGGYAKAQEESFYARQRELMAAAVAACDVVITTAAVPGKRAPVLITSEMVASMPPGSVIIDLAAERGGNCELTKPGETVAAHAVTILGPLDLPATVPYHASQMYARNISAFLLHLVRDGNIRIDPEDEIIREMLLTQNGHVVNPRVLELLVPQES